MSQETYEWLAANVVAGFTNDSRRMPWWAKGTEDNLYSEAVPMDAVERLLTSWEPVTSPLYDADMNEIDGYQLVRASDNNDVLTVSPTSTAIHTYKDWLTGTIKECVGDDAQISTAGLLRGRAQAWVQIERPEVSKANAGVTFLPYVTLSTSYDSSLASQINQGTINTVCDNTLSLTRSSGLMSRIKHTSGSRGRLADHRSVLVALTQGETEFAAEVNRLLDMKIDKAQFSKFMNALIPELDEDTPRVSTIKARKKQDITQLYKDDERAAEHNGTAWGALQAVNTWEQHMSRLVNKTGRDIDDTNLRAMRNYQAMAKGKNVSDDLSTVKVLESVI